MSIIDPEPRAAQTFVNVDVNTILRTNEREKCLDNDEYSKGRRHSPKPVTPNFITAEVA